MGRCYNCWKEVTLKNEETRCDNCNEILRYVCQNCHKVFDVEDKETKRKLRECKWCGNFICPYCKICSIDCPGKIHEKEINKILESDDETRNKIKRIVDYFEEIKLGKEQRTCLRGVPISYAKSRIKRCVIKLKGYRVKNQFDLEKFKERLEKIMDIEIGTDLTISQSREDGSYGQEFRDVFNYCLCLGKLKIRKIKKVIDGEEVELKVYRRVEEGTCPYLDLKGLIKKECPNKNCKIRIYSEKETYCICPECRYKKGKHKGELRKLKLKISNKDICQLPRGEFKKDGKSKYN